MQFICLFFLWLAALQITKASVPEIVRPDYQMCTLRTLQLLEKPESVIQTGGTCGMAAMLSLLAEHAPIKLMKLNELIFNNEVVLKTLEGFVAQMEKEGEVLSEVAKCDFILARGMMELLRETSQGELFYKDALKFLGEFTQWAKIFKNGTRGDLALRETHIEALLLYFGANATIVQSKGNNNTQDGFVPKWHEQINRCLSNRSVCPEPVVLAAVNGYSNMIWYNLVSSPYVRSAADPRFTHWIVIRDEITLKNGIYTITTWSWSRRHVLHVSQDVIDTYFIAGVYGSFDKK